MATAWYYKVFGEEFGPVLWPALRELAQSQTIGPQDEVRPGEDGAWQLAEQFPGLFSAVGDVPEPVSPGARVSPANTAARSSGGAGSVDSEVWFAEVLGVEFGPLARTELIQMAEQGVLAADSQVRRGTAGEWVAAHTIVDFDAIVVATSVASAPSRMRDNPPSVSRTTTNSTRTSSPRTSVPSSTGSSSSGSDDPFHGMADALEDAPLDVPTPEEATRDDVALLDELMAGPTTQPPNLLDAATASAAPRSATSKQVSGEFEALSDLLEDAEQAPLVTSASQSSPSVATTSTSVHDPVESTASELPATALPTTALPTIAASVAAPAPVVSNGASPHTATPTIAPPVESTPSGPAAPPWTSAPASIPTLPPGMAPATPPGMAAPVEVVLGFAFTQGREFGPFPTAELQRWLGEGKLAPTDFIRIGPQGDWFPAHELSERIPQWYCQVLGRELGPFALADLRQQARVGHLGPQALVKQGAAGMWMSAMAIPGLINMAPPGYPPWGSVPAPYPGYPAGMPGLPPGMPVAPGLPGMPGFAALPPGMPPQPFAAAPGSVASAMPGGPTSAGVAPGGAGLVEDAVAAPKASLVPKIPLQLPPPPDEVAAQQAAAVKANAEKENEAADQGAAEWYCQVDGNEYGPITFTDLIDWVKETRITADDRVRLDGTDEWVAAADIPELFDGTHSVAAGPSPASGAVSSSAATATTISSPRATPTSIDNSVASAATSAPAMAGVGMSAASGSGAGVGGMTAPVASSSPKLSDFSKSMAGALKKQKKSVDTSDDDSSSSLLQVLPLPAQIGLVAVIGIFLLWYFEISIPGLSQDDRKYLSELQNLYDEFSVLRDSGASDAEWSNHAVRSKNVCDRILPIMNKTASSQYPARQNMLWTCQSYHAMVEKSKKVPAIRMTSEERTVVNYLKSAKEALTTK